MAWLSLLPWLLAASGWSACGRCGRRPAAHPDTFVVQVDVEPPHLNPVVREGEWLRRLTLGLVFEPLVVRDHRTYALRPGLATAWHFSSDGRTLTLDLRRGVHFHDGHPFTARDVLFTLGRVMDPSVTSGFERASLRSLSAWTAPSEHRVVLRFRQPAWRVLESLAHLAILPEHVYGAGDLSTHPANRRPVGTGPYRFDRWEQGSYLRYVRFHDYWGRKPALGSLVFRFVRSRTKALELARAGEVDLVPNLLPEQVCAPDAPARTGRLRANFRLVVSHPVQLFTIVVNHRNPALADVRVRRALLMLVDRQALVRELYCGYATVVSGPFWSGGPGYDHSIRPWPHDPKRAARLLEEAGWRDRDGDGVLDRDGRPLSLTYFRVLESSVDRRMVPIVAEGFRRAGIRVRVEPLSWNKVLARLRTHDFDLVDLRWSSDVDQDLLQLYHSSQCDGGGNYGCFSDSEVDELLERIHVERDPAARHTMERKLHRLFHEKLPALFLFEPAVLSLVSRSFEGLEPSAEWFDLTAIRPARL